MNTVALVGREQELDQVRHLVRRTKQGTGSCLVVEGPAGIGKSRLLAEAIADATSAGVVVAAGRTTELDGAAPLTPLLTALRPSVQLAELNPVVDNRFLLISRLGELIEASARARPILIVLDDLHWADELTILTLRMLVPALHTSPVGWLLAMRPLAKRSPVRDAIRWIAAEHGQQIRLGPLGRNEIAQVCRNVLGAPPSGDLLLLAERTGGNPFLLGELLSSLVASSRIHFKGGQASVVDTELPASFIAAVHARLQEMSPPVRQLLDAAAVLGRPFSVHEAAALVGRPVAEVVATAAEAVAGYALVETGSDLMFRHDLIREATYSALSAPARQALHREAVAVVRAEGRPAVEAAKHLIRVARKGDDQAIELLSEAVAELRVSAPGAAADLLIHLLELLGDGHPQRPARIAETVRLLAASGRLHQAKTLGETALASRLDAPVEAGILAGLAEIFKHAGQDRVVVEYADRALALQDVPDALRAQLLAVRAHGLLYLGDAAGAEQSAQEAMRVGRAAGDVSSVVLGAEARSVAARSRGQLGHAMNLASLAVDLAEKSEDDARWRAPRLWLCRTLIGLDRLEEADRILDLGQREAEQRGTVWSMPLWHQTRSHLRLATGRLDDAIAEAEAGLLIAEQLEATALSTSLLATLAWLAIRQGRVAEAHSYLRRSQRSTEPRRYRDSWRWAMLHDARGKQAEAITTLTSLFAQLEHKPGLLTFEPYGAPYLVRLARCTGAVGYAHQATVAAARLAEDNPEVLYLSGIAAHAVGLRDSDADALSEAIAILRKGPRKLALASALEDKAYLDQLSGRRSDAIGLLEEALAHYTAALAHGDITRINRRLRELGVRRQGRDNGMRKLTGWASLTQSELKVVRLVAEGKTNRAVAAELFLSPHTVDSHLRHAFAKLGVTSRVELARRVLTEEVVPPRLLRVGRQSRKRVMSGPAGHHHNPGRQHTLCDTFRKETDESQWEDSDRHRGLAGHRPGDRRTVGSRRGQRCRRLSPQQGWRGGGRFRHRQRGRRACRRRRGR